MPERPSSYTTPASCWGSSSREECLSRMPTKPTSTRRTGLPVRRLIGHPHHDSPRALAAMNDPRDQQLPQLAAPVASPTAQCDSVSGCLLGWPDGAGRRTPESRRKTGRRAAAASRRAPRAVPSRRVGPRRSRRSRSIRGGSTLAKPHLPCLRTVRRCSISRRPRPTCASPPPAPLGSIRCSWRCWPTGACTDRHRQAGAGT